MNKDFTSENQKLTVERNDLRSKLDKLIDELKQKTKKYDTELSALSESLSKSQAEATQLAELNKELNEQKSRADDELAVLRETTTRQVKTIDELSAELDSLRVLSESTMKDSQLELKVKLENLSKELNAKWSETLK